MFLQKLKNLFWHLPQSIFFNIVYAFPSRKLTLIGVTGTDGKTTTATLLYHTLQNAGFKTGLISTIEAKIGDQSQGTGLHTTSPHPHTLQKLFFQMKRADVTHIVCEVTSHALDQHRFWGCHFFVSLITNTSHEHLDYHQTQDNYVKSKALLFSQSTYAVLNKDDPSYKIIKKTLSGPSLDYSIKAKSPLQAKNIKLDHKKLQFKVKQILFQTDSNYYYQVYNILSAFAVTQKLNLDPKFILKTIKKFPLTKGRREKMPNKFGFQTIIDFAHTPAALEKTLSSLKKTTPGRLIVIFGATGGRDQTKRPQMGKVVSTLANIALITADDTRNESVEDINRHIISGINQKKAKTFPIKEKISPSQIKQIRRLSQKHFVYLDIPRRQDAFNIAIKLASSQDTVIACGKGHETTILHGKTDYPWSETEAFRTALNLK